MIFCVFFSIFAVTAAATADSAEGPPPKPISHLAHPGSAQATCRSTEILPVAYTKMSIKSFTIEIFQF